MANAHEPAETAASPPDPRLLAAAVREARDEAAPFALVAGGVLVALAVVSRQAHWELLAHRVWWVWLIVAGPYVCLAATLLFGLSRLVVHDRRREIVLTLLTLVWVFNVVGVLVLVASLVSSSGGHVTGRQLLFSGGVMWLTDTIAFGLVFWELDCGGPVARALTTRVAPDFQFPQDENPELARAGWSPRLWDYFYVSLTNSIAFSATDAMPLTRPAKALMAAESALSAVTVLLVTARAVNILA